MADETKDPQREFEARLGRGTDSRLRIRLSKRPVAEGGDEVEGQAQKEPGYIQPTPPDDEFIPSSAKREILFYDLGTRLRSVPPGQSFDMLRVRPRTETGAPARNDDDGYFNEYVEMEYEWPAPVPDHLPLPTINRPPTLEEVQALDKILLGPRIEGADDTLDPFDFTPANVTGRSLPNCAPLPFMRSDSPVLTIIYSYTGIIYVGQTGYLLNESQEEKPAYKKRKALGRDEQERWNPHNLEESDFAYKLAHSQGTLTPRSRARVTRLALAPDFQNLSIPLIPHYEMFDTGDTDVYKVTTQPSYEAPEVVLGLGSSGQIHVYLKPRIVGYTLMHETQPRLPNLTFAQPTVAIWGRYPFDSVYPRESMWSCFARRSKIFGPQIEGGLNPSINRRPRNIELTGDYGYDDNASIPGALAGVLAQGKKVWYIWRKTALDLDRRDLIGVDFNDPVNAGLERKIFSSWHVGFRESGGDIGPCGE